MAILTRTILQDNAVHSGLLFSRSAAPAAQQDFTSLFKRISFYGYHQWQIFEPLQLIGGVTYDHITYPGKFSDRAHFRERTDGGSSFAQGRPDLDAAGQHHRPFRLYPLAGRREPGPKLPNGAFAGGGLHPILPQHHSGIHRGG